MVIDHSDNSVEFCEGGVWTYLADAATEAGVSEAEILAWAEDNLHGWNDYIMDRIVDEATKAIADCWRQDHPE